MNFFQRQAINLALAWGWKPLLRYLADKIYSYTSKSKSTWDDAIGKGLKNAIYIFAEIEGLTVDQIEPKLKVALNKVVAQTENQIDDVITKHIEPLVKSVSSKDYNQTAIIVAQITQEILSKHPITGHNK